MKRKLKLKRHSKAISYKEKVCINCGAILSRGEVDYCSYCEYLIH